MFGSSHAGAVTLVETPVSQAYARKARLAFFVTGSVTALLSAVALGHRFPPIVGLLLGVVFGVLVGAVSGVLVMAWPVARVLWHWSGEIALGLLVVFGWTALMNATSVLVSLLVVSALAGVPAGLPAVRRRLLAWVWCVIVRHRLRLCFSEFIRSASRTHAGSPPLILAARPTPAGERVWVWLRTGLDLPDIEGKTGKLAVACWADRVMVSRASDSYAALIRVDVSRRDPLTATVQAPLADLLGATWIPGIAASSDPPESALDLDDVPEPPTVVHSVRR